jgi:hypothetical protein
MNWAPTETKRWEFLAQPKRGEHSLWRKAGDPKGVVYLADCSGNNPSNTEDGPLCLVGDLRLGRGGTVGIVANVAVQDAMAVQQGYTMLHPLVAIWLIENEGFKAVIKNDELRLMAKLIGLAT